MWEFIAFVLFGFFMARVGAVLARNGAAQSGAFEHDGAIYRVTKIEE